MKFQFGDIVVNEWASEDNPLRQGIFVREHKNTYEFTDANGDFWQSAKHGARLRKVGSVLACDWAEGNARDRKVIAAMKGL